MKKFVVILLVSMLMLASFAGCDTQEPEVAASGDEVLGTYEDYSIDLLTYNFFFRSTQYQVEQQALSSGEYTESNIADVWNEEQDGAPLGELLQEQSLAYAKYYSVLNALASEAGVTVPYETKDDSALMIEELYAEVGGTDEAFMNTFHMTVEQMKEIYAYLDLADAFATSLEDYVDISDDEVKAVYDADPDSYAQVTVRHVLFLCNDDMTEEEQAEAEEKASDVLSRIQNGEDIGELAEELSEDGGSSSNKGEYTFGRGVMVTEFEDWAFAAEVGDQGIVKTDYGYHVMEMFGHAGYEVAEAEIRRSLAETQITEILDKAQTAEWNINNSVLNSVAV